MNYQLLTILSFKKIMPGFKDQLGRIITLHAIPQRIVSIVPSQTELLYDLGLNEKVIGITQFCIHPKEWLQTKTIIGGTKKLHIEKIKALQPDLIIANKEENVKEQVESLALDFPVWVSDVNTLADALEMILSVGQLVNKESEANILISQIQNNFFQLQTTNHQPPTGYLIWRQPYMTTGGDTFIHDMLQYAGFQNVFGQQRRYPEITIEELQASNCELLLLSSEPYPFSEKHIAELQPVLPRTKIILADGEMFSWYGSRLLGAPSYFQQLQRQLISL